MREIVERLFALQDEEYRRFHRHLIPTVDPAKVIGVRMPILRRLAKDLAGTPTAEQFISTLPHHFYEENMLHALLVERIPDYTACVTALESFLPHIDNWAVCDSLSPVAFRNCPTNLPKQIRRWLTATPVYTVRFGVVTLMKYYLDETFVPEYPALVAAVSGEDYYIRMAVAWYFATALAKQWDAVIPFMTERRLPLWTHNKTIQKAVESYRITPEQKVYLRNLKRKE